MKQFAADYSLDYRSSYTPEEIAQAIRRNPAPAATYRAELVKLAGAVGYSIPADLAGAS